MPTPEPHHDHVHLPRDDRKWRESYYFSFFDERSGLGGFNSIGRRPASGHTGSINVLWGPDRPTLVASEYDSAERHDDDHLVANLRYRAHEAFGAWQLTFDGRLNDGGSDVECDHDALGPTEKSPAEKRDVTYDLTFTPDAPPYLYEEAQHWRRLFDGHIDEVGRVTGTVTIGGKTVEIDGRGAKDHSWGVRDWYGVQSWRWMDVVSAQGIEVALWRGSFDGEKWFGDGALYGDGRTTGMTGYRESVQTAPRRRKDRPASVELDIRAGERRVQLTGDVLRIVPIFFSREQDGTREVSWNDRALVRCSGPDGSAWANVEFTTLLREPL